MTPDTLVANMPRFIRRDIAINEDIEEYLDRLKKYVEGCKAFYVDSCKDNVNDIIDAWGIELPDCAVVEKATMAFGNTTKIIYLKDEEKEEMTNKSQSKFAVGDKVVRTEGYYAKPDKGFMQEGDTYVVKELLEDDELLLEGSDVEYSCSCFELAPSKLANMKFRVNSPEHSKEIQEALFEMGYVWKSYGNKEMFTENANTYDWLYTTQDGCIWLGNNCSKGVKSAQEFTVETTKSYKLIPVETPKPETIEIDGKTYDKEAVLKRLAELDSVD